MFAAGVALALAAAAWQYLSPAAGELSAGRDVSVALLGERASALLIYHPFSDTVSAFTQHHPKPRRGVSPAQRAANLAAAALGGAAGKKIFFVALSTSPSLDALWGVLNNWRSDPRLLLRSASLVYGLKKSGATDLSGFDLFTVCSELLRLGSANFILTEVSRKGPEPEPAAEESVEPAAPRVEVFNASGVAGLAAATAKRLRAAGFDVITESSYPTRERQTRILGFSRDTAAALRLRQALGLEELEIHVKPSGKSVAGAAVILGQDFGSATKK